MRFLVDAQLPPALARLLSDRGHIAEHVVDCGLERASDRAVWAHAVDSQACIVTKDEDFAVRRMMRADGPTGGCGWAIPPGGNCCAGSMDCCHRFSPRWSAAKR